MKCLLKLLFIIPLCVACSSDVEEEIIHHGMKKAAIGFNADMADTRAVAIDDNLKADGFSVWGGYEGDAPKTVFDGRKVTYDTNTGKWTYENEEYWTHNTYNFHAVYPTPDANVNKYTVAWDNTNLQFTITDFDSSTNTDLLHASLTDINGSTYPKLNLDFNHLLTNVNVELVKHDSNAADDIQITGVYIYNLYTKGDFSWSKSEGNIQSEWILDNESAYLLGTDLTTSLPSLKVENTTEADNYGYTRLFSDMLFIPQEITTDRKIYLFVLYNYKYETAEEYITNKYLMVELPAEHQWMMGSKIIYRATITAHMNITFGNISVQEWNSQPTGGTIIIK